MGNFHCVPDSCGRVVYREYLPPSIRYRYPNEDWQTIEGADNYTLGQKKGQCSGVLYRVTILYAFHPQATYYQNVKTDKYAPIVRVFGALNASGSKVIWLTAGTSASNPTPKDYEVIAIDQRMSVNAYKEITNIQRLDGKEDNCGDCVFTVYKNDEIIHEETREVCPEVEQLPCRLSDVSKQIEIKKIPWTKRIEVVDYGFIGFGFNTVSYPLPENCLNIYRNDITGAIPPFTAIQSGFYDSWEYIAQICSASDCPPPEYQVICDCDCKECPDGSCAVRCGDRICCYDTTTGKAVDSIAIDEYCGDVS